MGRRFGGNERCQGRAAYHRVDGTGVRKPAEKVLDGLSLLGKTHQEKTKEPLRRQIPEIRLSVLSVREKTLRHGPRIEGGPELVGQVPEGARTGKRMKEDIARPAVALPEFKRRIVDEGPLRRLSLPYLGKPVVDENRFPHAGVPAEKEVRHFVTRANP